MIYLFYYILDNVVLMSLIPLKPCLATKIKGFLRLKKEKKTMATSPFDEEQGASTPFDEDVATPQSDTYTDAPAFSPSAASGKLLIYS